MTTSKTLRLKKPLNVMQQTRLYQVLNPLSSKGNPKKESADNKNKEKKISEDERASAYLKKKALFEAIDWLCVTYPNCFSREDPKPLKVGIFNDILLEGRWPHSKTALRKTLGFYTGSPNYQNAIIQLELRYSLNGEVSQGIADFEKENAIKKQQVWEERKKEKKKKLKNKKE